METKREVLEWLIEPDDVSVRYRALSELFGRGPNDKELKEAKAAIPGSSVVTFPFIYMPGLIEPVYALSMLGCGNRKEMKEAWSLLESREDGHGRLPLERTVVWPHIRVAPRGRPSKWLTLYACLARKQRNHGATKASNRCPKGRG